MSADDKTRILPGMANTSVGTQLSGIYELDERIASGGMGEVYRGHNIQTGDHVAIKIVLPEFARDLTILSLFRKEASILNHLSHDAIVRYHVFTIDPGIVRPYLAMEYVDGVSLADLIARGPMEAETVRRLIARIASGLSAAHAAGVIHRDLSPDNVILPGGKVEKAKIIDFGIARSATVGGETLIGGGFAGKYNYVSPEQLGLYGGEVSERSDIYSLGLVLAAALRGKPIEMSGSQFEIVEKRRTVPDLSDIDGDFRPIVEAMLQPDPRNRPASMAEIAAVTRGGSPIDIDGMMSANSVPAHDRQPAWPQTEQPASANPWVQLQPSNIQDRSVASKAAAEPRFVPHVRPAHLSQPHPAPSTPPRAITPKKSTNIRNITIAALTAAVVASGAGVYLGGFVPPWRDSPAPDSGETSRLTPDLSNPPTIENATAGNQPAEEVAPPHTQTEEAVTPSGNQPDAAGSQGQKAAQPADDTANSLTAEEILERLLDPSNGTNGQREVAAQPADTIVAASPPTEAVLAPATDQPDAANDDGLEAAQPADTIVAASPPTQEVLTPATDQPDAAKDDGLEAAQPADTIVAASPPTEEVLAPATDQPDAANGQGQESTQPEVPVPSVNQPDVANDQPASDGQYEPKVAIIVPKPQTPPTEAIDGVADRVSWVRDYRGGDCFYATATSATDKAIEIEGFGTTVEPFMQMMGAFQAQFHVEPDVSVRLIEPAQCEVTHFLRTLGATTAEKPKLTLDHTLVRNDFPISGSLETRGRLRSSLLLIDHEGMAFNLDDRVTVQSGKAIFSIPIGLGATDKAAGKVVPQIMVVVTGAEDIQAAAFSTPTPAAIALPKILAEVKAKRLEFSATAKYFRLGG